MPARPTTALVLVSLVGGLLPASAFGASAAGSVAAEPGA
ncbi:MAG: hypothetical protein AVDCRST_MAG79-80, partial [uncultured Thermoleophilia bacterium]